MERVPLGVNPSAQITVLYDGKCPLCAREVRFLQRRDSGRGRLGTLDITAAGFDPAQWGLTLPEVHAAIHAIDGAGQVVRGPEVFRRAYAAIGLGWVTAWTAWPIFRPAVDAAYRWFARNRHRLTGRTNPCETGACVLPDR